jgi:outer membrane protein
MKNPLQLTINAVLLIAVAVLYFLHFNQSSAAKPGTTAKPAAVVSPEASPTTDSTAVPAVAETETVVADAASAVPAAAANGEGKIAYIESGKLLDGYQGMKDARRAFEAKAKGWERQNEALITGFRSAVEAYQKQAASLTAEQRAATEQKLQGQQQQAGMQQEKLQRQAQEEEAKLTQTVLSSLNKKVEAYGKAHGYKLILIAAPSGTIAYGQKDLDITTPVLAYLNAEYRKK